MVGEHEWNGRCHSHGPLTETEDGKEYSAMNSKAAKELKEIVLDCDWMKRWKAMSFSGTGCVHDLHFRMKGF